MELKTQFPYHLSIEEVSTKNNIKLSFIYDRLKDGKVTDFIKRNGRPSFLVGPTGVAELVNLWNRSVSAANAVKTETNLDAAVQQAINLAVSKALASVKSTPKRTYKKPERLPFSTNDATARFILSSIFGLSEEQVNKILFPFSRELMIGIRRKHGKLPAKQGTSAVYNILADEDIVERAYNKVLVGGNV